MKVIRGLRISARQLGAHRTRTALALLGMVIGVSSVIAMVAVGHGARRDVMARVEAMGTDLIMVTPAQIRSSAGRAQIRGTVTTLTPRDANAILEEVPEIMAVAPWASKRMPVKFEALSSTTTILGVSPTVLEVLNVGTATGSFYTERDELTAGRSVVLGPTVARTLFGQRPAVGQKVLIGKVPFEVIGVLFPRGTDLSGTDQDDVVMIPLRTSLRRVFNQEWLGGIYLRARNGSEMERAEDQVRWLLRDRHRLDRVAADDDFEIHTQQEIMAAQQEIGLRLAVGGRRRDIRTQFLTEAVMLGVGGGGRRRPGAGCRRSPGHRHRLGRPGGALLGQLLLWVLPTGGRLLRRLPCPPRLSPEPRGGTPERVRVSLPDRRLSAGRRCRANRKPPLGSHRRTERRASQP